MNKLIARDIVNHYKSGSLIPVIGAGCSIAFGAPSWKKLIKDLSNDSIENKSLIEAADFYIERYDYWNAIENIKQFGNLNEQDIQEYIADKLNSIKFDKSIDNNLKDIASMEFNVYLTTNYDNYLYQYLPQSMIPICLSEINFNTQSLFQNKEKRIFHLHGHTSNPGTIVITKESYNKLYSDKKYEKLFNLLGGSKVFLFLGMSFDDYFMKKLLYDHVDIFKSKSYILLEKANREKFEALKREFNVDVIEYDASNIGHVAAIRLVLNEISGLANQDAESKEFEILDLPIGAKLNEDKLSEVENYLFYKKLKLEEVDEFTLELCKLYFVAAEEYVLKLRKNVISSEVLEKIFFIIFTLHREQFIKEFKNSESSQKFVEKVHEVLNEIDLTRFMDVLSEKQRIIDNEQQGLIHILADEPDKDIWWGLKRFSGGVNHE